MARTRKGNNSKAPTTVQADISESLTTNTSEQNDAPSTPTKGGMPVNAHMSTKSPRRRVTTRRASTLPGSPLHTPRKRTNERPGLIGKVTRRSKQEVAAEKATKVAKKKAAADEKMKAKERLAIMEMETAAAEGTRKKNVLRRLPSTIPDEPDSSVGEDFDWNEGMAGSSVGDGSDNDHDAGDKITTTAVQVKRRKVSKRELLKEVAKLKTKKNAFKLPVAEGLRDNYKRGVKFTKNVTQNSHDVIGGLQDEDALSARPNFNKTPAHKRANTYVDCSSDEEHEVPPPKRRAKTAGPHTKEVRPRETSAVPSENENGTTGNLNQTRALVGKASKFKTTIVPKRSTHDTDLVKAEAVANSANSALIDQIGSATRFRDLPSTITNSAALKQFRSTCFHGWMASDNLFEDFTKDSDVLLNIVRTAFTKAFPDLAYVPCCKDVFHHTIYDNIQTNRSNTARHAIQAVTIYLDGMPADDVRNWVAWTRAVRLGELIYSHPCPEGSSIIKGDPNFVKPQGLFMTNFVTDLAKPHLQYMNTSLIDYGHPRGLLALILVALERAARAFTSGIYKDPGQFSANLQSSITEYMRSVDSFTKWDDFYKACKFSRGTSSRRNEQFDAEMSQIDIGRQDLNFSSPVRG